MHAFLIDAYRTSGSIALWLKTDRDVCIEVPYQPHIYVDDCERSRTALRHMPYEPMLRRQYDGTLRPVLRVAAPLARFEQFVQHLEELLRFRVELFNADIAPEQQYLMERRLTPCATVAYEGERIAPSDIEAAIPLQHLELAVYPGSVRSFATPITGVRAGSRLFSGDEGTLLRQFAAFFEQHDPDAISMHRAYQSLPHLAHRLALHGISCALHRWHATPIRYKGGRTYWTYGVVRYQDYAVRLHGRLLIDTSTTVGSACDIDAIIELCQLSGNRFQHVASRSFGAVFQANLVRKLVEDQVLVPYKEKPIEPPLSMVELHAADRAGHTYDPLIGLHTDVAEIDFASMYPHLIVNHNISADTILCSDGPFEHVPGTHIRVSRRKQGYTPRALRPLLERRMHYKRNPSAINKRRAAGLKWVLVSCYGYLRFREFKLGLPSAHMAICAYARKTLLDAAALAESRGFGIVHGIIDALYLRKETTDEELRALCRDIELATGIPVSFEGRFKWIVFLPSVTDDERPVPTRYYGVFTTGEIKVRGIELRQRSVCAYVKRFQRACIEQMAPCTNADGIRARFAQLCATLRTYCNRIRATRHEELTCTVRISKLTYTKDCPQRRIVRALQRKSVDLHPGMTVRYVHSSRGAVLPEDFAGDADVQEYTKLLVRALYSLVQVFGFTKEDIEAQVGKERQALLT